MSSIIIYLVLSGVVNVVLGALWYSKLLFIKPYLRALGMTYEEMCNGKKKGMMHSVIVSFVVSIVTSWILWIIFINSGANGIGDLLFVSVALWLGFMALPALVDMLYGKEKQYTLWAVNAGFKLVFIIIVTFLYVWILADSYVIQG